MYETEYTEEALTDLEYFRKEARQLILDEVDVQLPYEPTVRTNNRKRLRGVWSVPSPSGQEYAEDAVPTS